MLVRAVKFSSSQIIESAPCDLCGFLLATDGVNDPTITFFNGTGPEVNFEVVPTCTYEASTFGLNGFMPGYQINCPNGLYVEVTNLVLGEGIVYVRTR
jgi:hypothetical protein